LREIKEAFLTLGQSYHYMHAGENSNTGGGTVICLELGHQSGPMQYDKKKRRCQGGGQTRSSFTEGGKLRTLGNRIRI